MNPFLHVIPISFSQVIERIQAKQSELLEEKKGNATAMDVVVAADVDTFDLNLWLETHRVPTEDDLDTLGSVSGGDVDALG